MLLAAPSIKSFDHMRQIIPPNNLMGSLCREQIYDDQKIYRDDRYCVSLCIEDGLILYNTLTGEMLLLSHREYEQRYSSRENKETLAQKSFIVQEGFDEKKYADQVRTIASLMQKRSDRINSFKLFTTTDCNARCFYCYEMGRSRVSMSDVIARDAAGYISRVSKGEKVKLNWFGGEPLYNQWPIEIITSELTRIGTEYVSTMISNGYLFDSKTIRKARDEWKLQNVQITLDGTEAVYNRTKAYVCSSISAYNRVIENIGALLDAGIKVKVRMNLHKNNAEDLQRLIEELSDRFAERNGFQSYIALLKDAQGSLFHFRDDRDALEIYRALNAMLLRGGIRKPQELKHSIQLNYCMADDDTCITILPDGKLGKCEHYSESEFVGSIYEDGLDQGAVASWKEKIDRIDECNTCAYYPLCNILKKCSYTANTCTELDRQIRLDELKERIHTSYLKATADTALHPIVI